MYRKTQRYCKVLLTIHMKLNPYLCIYFYFSEISRLQAGGSKGAGFKDPIKYVDVYRERPIRLTVRVLVPVREHPKVRHPLKFLQQ